MAMFSAARPFANIRRALPTPVNATKAGLYLKELVVELPSNSPPYDRALFPHWVTISEKCDARETVLKRDGVNVTTNSACSAVSGIWYSEYDGATWNDPLDLHIDHVVPLRAAWISGARNWTTSRRREFANDLIRPQLIAVTDNINQAKGDKDPSVWMPPLQSYHCTYVRAWIEVKYYYQ